VIYGGTQGFQGALTLNYVERRYLDMQNTVPAKAFMTADGSFGYRFRNWTVSMNIYNLGNRRDPVLASELGEDQIYRLTGRRAFMTLSVTLR
jgi:outer membrane receptor protein involved in Fe transport